MSFESHEASGAAIIENRSRGFTPKEIKAHYRRWTPQVVRQVCTFLDHTDGVRSISPANKKLLKHPDQLSKSVRLVTPKQLEQIIKPIMAKEGIKMPAKKSVPIGFVHPKTRRIYISTLDPEEVEEYQKSPIRKANSNPEVALQSWFRRVLVEETLHRFQDTEKLGRFFGETAVSYYLKEFYKYHHLPNDFMTSEDMGLARVYEGMMKKFGSETVNSILFGTYKGESLKEGRIKLIFMLKGETWERNKKNRRIYTRDNRYRL